MTVLHMPAREDEFTRRATAEWERGLAATPVDTYVYRYYDDLDVLLYVGATSRLNNRDGQHKRGSKWRSRAARRTEEGPFHRQIALGRELFAIADEGPEFNVYRANGYAGPGSMAWWERVSQLWQAQTPEQQMRALHAATLPLSDAEVSSEAAR